MKSGQLGKKRETTIALLFKGIYNTSDGLMSGMMGQCGLFFVLRPAVRQIGQCGFWAVEAVSFGSLNEKEG
jgi:hypothetical protein